MNNSQFSELVKLFRGRRNFDHPNVDNLSKVAKKRKVDPLETGRAFFVARDLETLEDLEKLEGGDGSEVRKTNLRELEEVNFKKK